MNRTNFCCKALCAVLLDLLGLTTVLPPLRTVMCCLLFGWFVPPPQPHPFQGLRTVCGPRNVAYIRFRFVWWLLLMLSYWWVTAGALSNASQPRSMHTHMCTYYSGRVTSRHYGSCWSPNIGRSARRLHQCPPGLVGEALATGTGHAWSQQLQ